MGRTSCLIIVLSSNRSQECARIVGRHRKGASTRRYGSSPRSRLRQVPPPSLMQKSVFSSFLFIMDTLSLGFRSKIENGMNVRGSHRGNVGESKFLAFQEDDVFAIGKLEESASKNFSKRSKDFSLVFIEEKRAKGARLPRAGVESLEARSSHV